MDGDNNDNKDIADLLKLFAQMQSLDPSEKLPDLDEKDIRSTIRANKSKLTCIVFAESKFPLINQIHKSLNPIQKDSRMVQVYLVDISKSESAENLASDYNLKNRITTILYKDGKELERFEGLVNEDDVNHIKEQIPKDPFSGKVHTINPQIHVNPEEYLKSVKRTEPASPPPEKKKVIKKHYRYDDYIKNLGKPRTIQPYQQSFQPPPQPQGPPVIPFINPFTEEYKTIKENLKQIPYEDDDIEYAFLAGASNENECSDYIENVRNGRPNDANLTYPGFKIENLPPAQKEVFEELHDALDKVQIVYILLYTGTESSDDLIEYHELATDHKEIPYAKTKSAAPSQIDVDKELDLIMQRIQPNQSLSNTAPINTQYAYYDRFEQEQARKDIENEKKRREEQTKHRLETIKRINEQRMNQKLEEKSLQNSKNSLSKTLPSKPQSPAKPQTNNKTATIRFSLPDGKIAQYQFATSDTFETIEKKLKENNNIGEEDVVEFTSVLAQIRRDEFGLTLQEKNISGRILMTVVKLQQPAQDAEAPQ